MKEQLLKLRKEYEDIASQWNGDDSGLAEDRAHEANSGIEHIDGLLAVIDNLEINF